MRMRDRGVRGTRPARLAWLLALAGACGDGCHGCDDTHVAELVATHDIVDRDRAKTVEQWQRAVKGDRFHVGDAVRTGSRASAVLRLVPEGELRVKSGTVVRFQDTPPGNPEQVRVEAGEIEIESAGVELDVRTLAGMARITRGSRVAVRHAEGQVRFDVALGRVQVEREDGVRSATTGEGFSVDVGPLAIEPTPPPSPPPAPLASPDAGIVTIAETVPLEDLGEGFGVSPARAHLAIPGGESATVHDARPPTHVAIGFEGCTQGGIVEVGRGTGAYRHFRARGQGSAVVPLAAGTYRYRVRCVQGTRVEARAKHEGRLQMLRDAGVRRLPRTPPSVEIDADGRRYTVRYQNLLPKITLRWPGASDAVAYEIEVRSPNGGLRRESAPHANHVLRSGDLPEGDHRFRFLAGDGMRSPESTLRIAFDNTARTAYVSDPPEDSATPGAVARVAGAALRGSRVSAHGVELPLSDQGRFVADVPVPTATDALAIRVQHAATGVHYYLRHLAGSGK